MFLSIRYQVAELLPPRETTEQRFPERRLSRSGSIRDSSMESPSNTICGRSLLKMRPRLSLNGSFGSGAKTKRVGKARTTSTIAATANQFQRAEGGVDGEESIM